MFDQATLATVETALDTVLGEWKTRVEHHRANGRDASFAEQRVAELRQVKEVVHEARKTAPPDKPVSGEEEENDA